MDATATGHWKRVLSKMPAEELFALEEQVADLTRHAGWERVVAFITAGHNEVLKSLTQGSVDSHPRVSRAVGYLAGLEEAPNVVQAIAEAALQRRTKLEKAAVADQTARQEAK